MHGINERTRGIWFNGVLATASVAVLLVCCAASNDAISNAEKVEKDKPGIAGTRAIAEDGFIYGLPIVMNYAVMYEYAVDRDSGQFKAPFNEITTRRASSPTRTQPSLRRTATPRIPYYGWTCAPSRWCCRFRPWRNRATTQ